MLVRLSIGAELASGVLQLLAGGLIVGGILAAEAEFVLGKGVKTDRYEALQEVDVLDPANAASVFAGNIPPNIGIANDDNQPFPLYGWLEVKWVNPSLVIDTPGVQ